MQNPVFQIPSTIFLFCCTFSELRICGFTFGTIKSSIIGRLHSSYIYHVSSMTGERSGKVSTDKFLDCFMGSKLPVQIWFRVKNMLCVILGFITNVLLFLITEIFVRQNGNCVVIRVLLLYVRFCTTNCGSGPRLNLSFSGRFDLASFGRRDCDMPTIIDGNVMYYLLKIAFNLIYSTCESFKSSLVHVSIRHM